MAIINPILCIPSPGYTAPPLRTTTLNATRDGVQTSAYKEAVLWDTVYNRKPLIFFPLRNGISNSKTVVASAIDGLRAIILYDFEVQPYAQIRAPNINADIVLNIDLNDGSGGGGVPGDPAIVEARVRVNKQLAERELVAIEKTSTGAWRMAGNQLLQEGNLEMQVTGGHVYAVGFDDYGIAFQPSLPVTEGQRIRPTAMQGWLYVVTQAGQLPAVEPDWWPEQGENPPQTAGTARLQAVRYHRPLAHGPINYELI